MKKLAIIPTILIVALTLNGCSYFTRQQNRTAGGATGAVLGGVAGSFFGQGTGRLLAVGAGAVVGALVGMEIGDRMDNSDADKTFKALDHNAKNRAKRWKNKRNGNMYSVVPTSDFYAYGGYDYCRDFKAMTIVNKKRHSVSGTACKLDDGSWRTVS